MSELSEPANETPAENAVRRRRGFGWSVAALVCGVATVVAWLVGLRFESILPAVLAIIAGVVGIYREPRVRALAIVSMIPPGLNLALWAYFVVLTYITFARP
ncbi:hypothetical protein [Leifsonia shinshuensis]|uniref:Uncharacterized protein n=1 Tax=Leifsonia shinshuensis TaxID=150026 RepID=A0A853CU42_9MICO|nr:hypothetical protein [Leifsonia shinshuensis]NYJ23922.1 hypothetical protein [Leifsonia shinshuensis]